MSIATLRPILEAGGLAVDELHGSLLFPPTSTDYERDFSFFEAYSKFLFVPALNGAAIEQLEERVVDTVLEDTSLRGLAGLAGVPIDAKAIRERLRRGVASANQCLDRVLERMLAGAHDIVGFSCTFDDQMPAALVLARRLKRARPRVKVVFGGAACFAEQADGLVSSFPEVDAVCHTDGERVIVPLLRAITGDGALADVWGIAWRDPGGIVRHNDSPPLLRDLDSLPLPDYRGFMEQLSASEWSQLSARLLFETSRGCWWGQKSACAFCGLNAEGIAFRSKSPERAFEEVRHLYETYPAASHLQATDNILDLKYLATTFRRLAELPRAPERPLRVFYEVKSSMRPDQVQAMAAAGVVMVQPGIESFHDGVLALMRKGATGLGQVQFLKWCREAQIEPFYYILFGTPGERAEWYRELLDLVPYLSHLPPPTGMTTMMLERYSRYYQDPAAFGITNVRPRTFYRDLYPEKGVDLGRIAYQFDYDHPLFSDAELGAACRAFAAALRGWMRSYKEDLAFFVDDGDELVVVDRRDGGEARTALGGLGARLYRFLDRHRSRAQLQAAFPAVDPALLDCLLHTWLHRRWVCRDRDRWLAVLPRKGRGRAAACDEASRALDIQAVAGGAP